MRKMTTFTMLALATVLLFSCAGTVPTELAEANRVTNVALANAQANRLVIVNAYTAELRSAYMAQMDLIQKSALDSALTTMPDGTKVVPRSVADQVIALRQSKEAEIDAKLEEKRLEFLNDNNLDIAVELNAKVGEWMKVYVEEFAGRAQELARISGQLYKKVSGNEETPAFFDAITGDNQ